MEFSLFVADILISIKYTEFSSSSLKSEKTLTKFLVVILLFHNINYKLISSSPSCMTGFQKQPPIYSYKDSSIEYNKAISIVFYSSPALLGWQITDHPYNKIKS